MPDPIVRHVSGYGDSVVVPRALIGPAKKGALVRINVDARMSSWAGNFITNSRIVENWIGQRFLGHTQRETIGAPHVGGLLSTSSDGTEDRMVDFSVDGTLTEDWPGGEALRAAVADMICNAADGFSAGDLNFGIQPASDEVWIADLAAPPADVIVNQGAYRDQPDTSAFVEETAREVYGGAAQNVGAFAKGALGGTFSGLLDGLGWLGWLLLALLLVALVLVVVLVARGGVGSVAVTA